MIKENSLVGFIGLGKLGKPCAEVMTEKHRVIGYDVAPVKIEKVLVMDSIRKVCEEEPDFLFIAVPTPHDEKYDGRYPTAHLVPKDFDYTTVKEVITEVNKYVTNATTIVLISTVLPGTVRREIIPLIDEPSNFVYNPYLIAMGTVKWDMVNPEMIMIGTEDGETSPSGKALVELYETMMQNSPRYVVGTWDECECIKIFYNTFISTKIGLVNMIQDVAEKQGNIDVDVVTTAIAESTDRIMSPMYMKAGMGDGGACVKPDFRVNIYEDGKNPITMEDLYTRFHRVCGEKNKPAHCDLVFGRKEAEEAIKNGRSILLPIYTVESMNWAGTNQDIKKVADVTKRHYSGKMYTFTAASGKTVSVTEDHLIPVERGRKKIVIPAKDIKKSDKLFIFGG